jgi:hypothetical protein
VDTTEKLPRQISRAPSTSDVVRHATRLLSMVHELHKAGYQRIRIQPGLSPSGAHWRCNITYAGNVAADGYSIRAFDIEGGHVAPYSSANGSDYFGWRTAGSLNARQLAQIFVSSFPLIAEHGVGRDWPYAGWLTDVLGRAEQGRPEDLLTLYADYPVDRDVLATWRPPAP